MDGVFCNILILPWLRQPVQTVRRRHLIGKQGPLGHTQSEVIVICQLIYTVLLTLNLKLEDTLCLDDRFPFLALLEELIRVVVDNFFDQGAWMTTLFEFENQIGNRGWFTRSPVARTIGHQSLGAIGFNHVSGTLRGTFSDWIHGHSSPKASIEYFANRMLLHVVY